MKRLVLLSAMAGFALAVGCSSAGTAPPAAVAAQIQVAVPAQTDVDCEGFADKPEVWPGREATIRVGTDAKVDFPCSQIVKATTQVTWLGDAGVKRLTVVLKPCKGSSARVDGELPDNPTCRGTSSCTLEREKHQDQAGMTIRQDVCYHVFVVNKDKTWADFDPKLIIKP